MSPVITAADWEVRRNPERSQSASRQPSQQSQIDKFNPSKADHQAKRRLGQKNMSAHSSSIKSANSNKRKADSFDNANSNNKNNIPAKRQCPEKQIDSGLLTPPHHVPVESTEARWNQHFGFIKEVKVFENGYRTNKEILEAQLFPEDAPSRRETKMANKIRHFEYLKSIGRLPERFLGAEIPQAPTPKVQSPETQSSTVKIQKTETPKEEPLEVKSPKVQPAKVEPPAPKSPTDIQQPQNPTDEEFDNDLNDAADKIFGPEYSEDELRNPATEAAVQTLEFEHPDRMNPPILYPEGPYPKDETAQWLYRYQQNRYNFQLVRYLNRDVEFTDESEESEEE